MSRPVRWRCARVDCPAHAWQTIHTQGRQDARQIAEDALVRHWETTHDRQGDDVKGHAMTTETLDERAELLRTAGYGEPL